jgi:uncharacterized protein YecE (DUF72 family)
MTEETEQTELLEPNIRMGCGPFPKDRKRYFGQFSVVELTEMYHEQPKMNTLRGWRNNHGDPFEFIPVATQWFTADALDLRTPPPEGVDRRDVGLLRDTPGNAALWAGIAGQMAALEAKHLLVKTPATFFPTDANRAALARTVALCESVGARMIWEPRGVWTTTETIELGEELGFSVAVDPFGDDDFPELMQADAYYVLTGPRGRRDFTQDDFIDLVDFLREHEGLVTLIARGAERDRNAEAIARFFETTRA